MATYILHNYVAIIISGCNLAMSCYSANLFSDNLGIIYVYLENIGSCELLTYVRMYIHIIMYYTNYTYIRT